MTDVNARRPDAERAPSRLRRRGADDVGRTTTAPPVDRRRRARRARARRRAQLDADAEPILEVENLRMYFPVKSSGLIRRTVGHVQAVDGVSFQVPEGGSLGPGR